MLGAGMQGAEPGVNVGCGKALLGEHAAESRV